VGDARQEVAVVWVCPGMRRGYQEGKRKQCRQGAQHLPFGTRLNEHVSSRSTNDPFEGRADDERDVAFQMQISVKVQWLQARFSRGCRGTPNFDVFACDPAG
jgi:hypothetical protein